MRKYSKTYKPKLYKIICETIFKNRYANHKKYFNVKRKRTILNYRPNTGNWQIGKFTHGYPGVQKATLSHTNSVQKDMVCVCTKIENST